MVFWLVGSFVILWKCCVCWVGVCWLVWRWVCCGYEIVGCCFVDVYCLLFCWWWLFLVGWCWGVWWVDLMGMSMGLVVVGVSCVWFGWSGNWWLECLSWCEWSLGGMFLWVGWMLVILLLWVCFLVCGDWWWCFGLCNWLVWLVWLMFVL